MKNRVVMGDSFMDSYRKRRFLDEDFDEELEELDEEED